MKKKFVITGVLAAVVLASTGVAIANAYDDKPVVPAATTQAPVVAPVVKEVATTPTVAESPITETEAVAEPTPTPTPAPTPKVTSTPKATATTTPAKATPASANDPKPLSAEEAYQKIVENMKKEPPAEISQMPQADTSDTKSLKTLAAWLIAHPTVREYYKGIGNPNGQTLTYDPEKMPTPPGYMGEWGGDWKDPAYLTALADYYDNIKK